MRTSFFAFVLLASASVLAAAVPAGPAEPSAPSVTAEAPSAEDPTAATRLAARVVIRSKKSVPASISLRDSEGKEVRTYRDAMLWKGRTTLTLDIGGLPFGRYDLVIKTPYGSHRSSIVI